MSFFSELSLLPADELKHWFGAVRPDTPVPTEDRELLLQEVAVRIAETSDGAADFFRSCIPQADDDKLVAILLGLYFAAKNLAGSKRGEVISLLRTYLDDPRPRVIAEAVDSLSCLGCSDLRNDIMKLGNHLSPLVTGSFLRFMARHFPTEAVPVLERALESAEPIVRENAVDELDDLDCLPALPKIKKLLKDPNANVRQAARTAVEHLEAAQRESLSA